MGDLDLDVLATAVRSELSEHPTRRIVIDSLSELAFAAREGERFPAYMRSLVGLVRAAGSSLLVTSETAVHGLAPNAMDGLLFLFDNVIDLRYIEDGSRVGRAAHVAKMRSSRHEMTLNSVSITDRGLVVGSELESVTGRLGWSALRTHGPLESVRPVAKSPAVPSQSLAPQPAVGSSRKSTSGLCTSARAIGRRLGTRDVEAETRSHACVRASGVDLLRRAG
jgi:circadian clock protein KaiC